MINLTGPDSKRVSESAIGPVIREAETTVSGNTIQLAAALGRMCTGPGPRDTSFHVADQQALCSLLAFLLGAGIGRIGDRIGTKSRLWLCGATLFQSFLSLLAAVVLIGSGEPSVTDSRLEPSWTSVRGFAALALVSAGLGAQAAVGQRLGTPFATTGNVPLYPMFHSLTSFSGTHHRLGGTRKSAVQTSRTEIFLCSHCSLYWRLSWQGDDGSDRSCSEYFVRY